MTKINEWDRRPNRDSDPECVCEKAAQGWAACMVGSSRGSGHLPSVTVGKLSMI